MADQQFDVSLPDEVVNGFGWQKNEVASRVKEALVMELVRRHSISQGKASELLDISRWDLLDLMGRHQVPAIELTSEELRDELSKTIPSRNDLRSSVTLDH